MTKEEEIEQVIAEWFQSGNENQTHLAHLIAIKFFPQPPAGISDEAKDILIEYIFSPRNGANEELVTAQDALKAMNEYANQRIGEYREIMAVINNLHNIENADHCIPGLQAQLRKLNELNK
jgi:hypothetical protein